MKKIILILTLLFSIITFGQNWNGIWNPSNPTNTSLAQLSANYTTSISGDFTCLELKVKDGNTLTISSGTFVNVINELRIEGTGKVIVEDGGNFLSGPTAIFVGVNATNFIVKKTVTQVKTFDYTLFSSPVVNSNFTGIPSIINSRRFKYVRNSIPCASEDADWSANLSIESIMELGIGYPVHSDVGANLNTFSTIPRMTYTNLIEFKGVPNNGNLTIPIYNPNSPYFLTGNPYPSNIDVKAFLMDNPTVNYIYLWAHNSLPNAAYPSPCGNPAQYNYTNEDYALYNRCGGVRAGENDLTFDNFDYEDNTIPSDYVSTGQGFFIKKDLSTTELYFNNYIRTSNTSHFYRQDDLRHRLWISLSSPTFSSQCLVGYVYEATNGIDNQFDVSVPKPNYIYTIADNTKLNINGRELPFEDTDQMPLGYTLMYGGQYQISIDMVDGLFTGDQDIFIQDNLTGVTQSIKTTPYIFMATAGTVEDRFILKFIDSTLGNDDNVLTSSNTVIYSDNGINIKNNLEKIKNVTIFDVAGRRVHNGTYNDNSVNVQLNASKGVYIVKVSFENGSILTRKIIN